MKFTPSQQAAIDARGADILVSAAAGSGKTAVLTERIVKHITQGVSLDQLLVVTFTEAAASEMRERIGARLAEMLEAKPDDVHLARQAALLPRADISTIHAFCRKLLKERFQEAGLDPSFNVSDEAETRLIQAAVMDELLEDEYSKEDNEAVLDLADAFSGKTGDGRFTDLVRSLFLFLESDPYPERAAERYADGYRAVDNLDDTVWAKIALDELTVGLDGALDGIAAARKICAEQDGPVKYMDALQADEDMIRALHDAAKNSFTHAYHAFKNISWARIASYKKTDAVDAALKERAQAIRNKDVKDRVNGLSKSVFFTSPDKMLNDINALSARITELLALTLRFRDRYAAEKRSRNLLDFNDLEHYAIQILTAATGEPTPAALSYQEKYREVLIDEYQDSNSIQELILSAVAGTGRRFMVGDVKQGIYRFRNANPSLFIEKYEKYKTYGCSSESEAHGIQPIFNAPSGIRIDLSSNFRSRAHIIDAVNFLFTRLMDQQVGEISYDDRAKLYPGADFPALPSGVKPETWVEIADASKPDEAESEDEEEPSALEREASVIANCVKELQATHGYRLSDIVVLVRSISSIAKPLTEALKNRGVDAVADLTTGFYGTAEVRLALSFLRVTDNPRQDIDLITVLHSPVYAFTPDELLDMRLNCRDGDFYDALLHAATDKNNKADNFLTGLSKWRECAAYMPVSRLIGIIYDDTALPEHMGALPGGAIRQANLRLLLERAIQYEETTLTGLFHFIHYIERLYSTGGADSVSAAQATRDGADRLRILTIHKSKGLQFKAVFVSQLGRQFNRRDERGGVITHPLYGIGASLTDTEEIRVRSNTIGRYALSRLIRREAMSEELRVLYVAMTRAEEMLILTGAVNDYDKKRERWETVAERDETLLPIYYRRESQTGLDLLMPCVLRDVTDEENTTADIGNDELFKQEVTCDAAETSSVTPPITQSGNLFRLRVHRDASLPEEAVIPKAADADSPTPTQSTTNAYPYEYRQPTKLSISELKRMYSDMTPDSTALFDSGPMFEPPAFLRNAQGISSMRIGTALHTVTEHIDWHSHTTLEAIDALICGLTERNLLTGEEAAAIDRDKILRLTRSPLASRIHNSSRVYREVPFVMRHDFFGNGEDALLHGIIDCFFEEDGEAVLLDYKSDRVTVPPAEWASAHALQMSVYKKAVAEATGLNVKETWLYSFHLGEAVRV